jgi:hypothetical protein
LRSKAGGGGHALAEGRWVHWNRWAGAGVPAWPGRGRWATLPGSCPPGPEGQGGQERTSNRAMLHIVGNPPSAIRGNAWHRNPEGHDISRMRTQLGRAAFGVAGPGIASSAFEGPRDGGARARTRRCQAPLRKPARRNAGPAAVDGRLGPGISSNRAMLHILGKPPSAIRGNAWPRNPEGHDISRMRTQLGRAAFGVAEPGIASSAFEGRRDGGARARTRRCQAPLRKPA